ncbi:hypothetical protein BDR07DRAFT_1492222 [Suillus spraguei]|nr:hypothetical protein BDR07DRAFT_1492222 [Suillus spraguei]
MQFSTTDNSNFHNSHTSQRIVAHHDDQYQYTSHSVGQSSTNPHINPHQVAFHEQNVHNLSYDDGPPQAAYDYSNPYYVDSGIHGNLYNQQVSHSFRNPGYSTPSELSLDPY